MPSGLGCVFNSSSNQRLARLLLPSPPKPIRPVMRFFELAQSSFMDLRRSSRPTHSDRDGGALFSEGDKFLDAAARASALSIFGSGAGRSGMGSSCKEKRNGIKARA